MSDEMVAALGADCVICMAAIGFSADIIWRLTPEELSICRVCF